MRILFVYANQDSPIGFNHGIAAMSGVLKARGHETRLIHLHEALGDIPTPADVARVVEEWRPGVLAFSTMTQQFDIACEYSRFLGERFPEIPRVVGGVHCTMVPEEAIESGAFDFMGVGECDVAFADFVDAFARGDRLSCLPNIWAWKASRFHQGFPEDDAGGTTGAALPRAGEEAGEALPYVKNPVGPFPDLAKLPLKDYEIFDLDRLFAAKNGWHSVLTSRGCPYKCTYCFNLEVVDRYKEDGATKSIKEYLRHYPLDRVFEEINLIAERHPQIKTIIFDDDLFTLNRAYVMEFCREYRRRTPGIPFVVNAHVQVFNDEMARALRDAGCMICKYGLESGSQKMRQEVLHRFHPNSKIESAFAAANRAGLHTSAFIMLGLPTETREQLQETLELCSRVEVGRLRWAIFYPFPGTAAYRIADELGVIDWDKWKTLRNYFGRSCLTFDDEMNFSLERLAVVCHWYVNAFSDWECAPIYRELCAELDGLTRPQWEERQKTIHAEDRELSESLLAKGVRHYSLRYSSVMGVISDFVLWERGEVERAEAAGREHREVSYNLE